MKLKMTVDEALEFADSWSLGMTIHEDSQGWRVVCMLLAEEVRRLHRKMSELKEIPLMMRCEAEGNSRYGKCEPKRAIVLHDVANALDKRLIDRE